MLYSNPVYSRQLRFNSNSNSVTKSITAIDLAGALGGICTVTNSKLNLFASSLKIRYVEVWAPVSAQGAAVSLSINFSGSANSADKLLSDTSVNVSVPAHIRAVPPRQTLASFYQSWSGTTTLMTLNVPQDAIIDVGLSFTITTDDGLSGSTPQVTISSGTLGNTYYLALDGPTSNDFVPVILPSTN